MPRGAAPRDVHQHEDHSELESDFRPIKLVREGRFLVADPLAEGPMLTGKEVADLLDAIALDYERGL
ncbi:MAG TPA: hypothetical protein VNL35_22145 [Chloroflexota bacterium]|nr:hypothetical protein [Chloroflexota bacterium]